MKGDSVNGFVDYRNWEKNPKFISFKKNRSKEKIDYYPIDIQEIGINDEKYISAIVDTEISSTNTNKLEISNKPNLRKDTVFLQTLIQGNKDLYLFVSETDKSNFYIKIENGYHLLIFKKYVYNKDGIKMYKENNLFKNQLASYLSDCSNFNHELKNIKYKQNQLKSLYKKYYQCRSETPSFDKKKEGIETEFMIFAGTSITKLNFEGESPNYLEQVNYPASFDVSAGASLNLILPRTRQSWSIYNSINLSTFNVEGSYYKEYASYNYKTIYTKFKYSQLKFVNTLRYTRSINKTKNFSYFIDAGITNGFVINGYNSVKEDITLFSDVREEEGKALEEIRSYEQGLTFGTGLSWRETSIELRYEKGNGLSKYLPLKSSTNRIYLFFGYKF